MKHRALGIQFTAASNLIQDRQRIVWPGTEGMIVHNVQDYPEAHGMDAFDHLTEFFHSARSVRIGRIASFWHPPVHRVISPVESVRIRHRGHQLLQDVAGGPRYASDCPAQADQYIPFTNACLFVALSRLSYSYKYCQRDSSHITHKVAIYMSSADNNCLS
eukprot:scaffold666258_cov59-Prasinocladus_malaysianus.AAC.1